MNAKDYCTTGEVALLARKSPATVRNWEKSGLLKAKRLGNGTRLFSRAEVERVIAKRRVSDGNNEAA